MTSIQQRAALQSQIWKIANDVRGAVDGWDFKQYVLGTLFYRFISENFAAYIEGGDDSIDYAVLSDVVITPEIRDDAIKTKGYFIYPSQLFARVAASANGNESLNTDLAACLPTLTPPATVWATPSKTKTPAWPPCSKAWPSWTLATLAAAISRPTKSTCLAMPMNS
jgi:type I restriction enzyme M protein